MEIIKTHLDILHDMLLEEENKCKYLHLCLERPNPLATKKYYYNQIKICEAKMEALSSVIYRQ